MVCRWEEGSWLHGLTSTVSCTRNSDLGMDGSRPLGSGQSPAIRRPQIITILGGRLQRSHQDQSISIAKKKGWCFNCRVRHPLMSCELKCGDNRSHPPHRKLLSKCLNLMASSHWRQNINSTNPDPMINRGEDVMILWG